MPKKPWSKARKHSYIVSVLRAGTRRWPEKYETLNEAKTEKKINKKTGRLAQHYACAACNKEFAATGVQVDHIQPVISKEGFTTWDSFIENLFCSKENLQVLCTTCHDLKTKKETSVRKEQRKNK
jgi:5-methylcytosine-specific restriction endonuclease McrA